MEIRIGHGLDVHPFERGRKLVVGGVEIPSEFGLKGHSDADVLLHAIVDAVQGATGGGDIGTLFPDTDATWANADSKIFLNKVWAGISGRGWRVVNLDCVLLAEMPKFAPHISAMRGVIAEILGCTVDRVGIKATTCEGLGFVGRREGVVASATVLLESGAQKVL